MKQRLRRAIVLAAANVLVLAAILVLLEIATRLVVDTHGDNYEYRLTRPAPYRDALYFSKEFIDESFDQPGGWVAVPGSNLLLPNNYSGKFFNVADNIRVTTDAPPASSSNIYLFGGSTVYNSEVPDAYTISSYLQRELVRNGYQQYRVYNLGVTSINTNQQLERLKQTALEENDLVIFYDGVNEVVQGVMFGNTEGTITGSERNRPVWQKLMYKVASHSYIVRRTLAGSVRNYRINDLEERISRTVERYRQNIVEAMNHTRNRGANFMHFLQPSLFSLARPGEYEQNLLLLEIVPIQAEHAFRAAYPQLEQVVVENRNRGIPDFSLTSAFDDLDDPVYLDFCHVNHTGNMAIAAAIFAKLVEEGAL
ncbi:MAG: hypothetical protein OEY45_09175 [Gammaproteobacteria bacterium]|nr:hypothetical protein [Gammaproteobacteria bacterium]